MKRVAAVLVVSLLLAGVQVLLPSPAGAELKVAISGSVRFNAIWKDVSLAEENQTPSPTFPITSCSADVRRSCKTNENDEFTVDARRTRIQIDATDEVQGVKLAGRVQGDFQTTDGTSRTSQATHLRLRLAYGQATLGGFTLRFGQLRTLMSEFGDNLIGGVADPDVLTETGHFTQNDARIPGINAAWMAKFMGGDLTAGVSVERMATRANVHAIPATFTNSAALDSREGSAQEIPLFLAGVRFRTPLFAFFVRGGGSQVRAIIGSDARKASDEEGVWIGAVGAEVKPLPPLRILAQYWHSEGAHSLSSSSPFTEVVAVGNALAGAGTQELFSVPVDALHGGIEYKLTKDLRVGALYTYASVQDMHPAIISGSTIRAALTGPVKHGSTQLKTVESWSGWFIHQFWTRFDWGLGFEHVEQDFIGDFRSDLNIGQLRLRFYF